LISNQGYRCESGIAIFGWRVTWTYAYRLFNQGLFYLWIYDWM